MASTDTEQTIESLNEELRLVLGRHNELFRERPIDVIIELFTASEVWRDKANIEVVDVHPVQEDDPSIEHEAWTIEYSTGDKTVVGLPPKVGAELAE